MDKIVKVKQILNAVGLPERQQTDLCALTVLALANINKNSAWNASSN